MTYIREDQASICVSLDGNVLYGASWKSAEGGNLEADNAKTRPGAMGREVDHRRAGRARRPDGRDPVTDVTVELGGDSSRTASASAA